MRGYFLDAALLLDPEQGHEPGGGEGEEVRGPARASVGLQPDKT